MICPQRQELKQQRAQQRPVAAPLRGDVPIAPDSQLVA